MIPVSGAKTIPEIRLLLEELCCDLCRFHHVMNDGCAPEHVRIDREFSLGAPGAYADIRVKAPRGAAYFVEVKVGYAPDTVCRHLRRKYGPDSLAPSFGSKVIVLLDGGTADWRTLEADIRHSLSPALDLELWDEPRLLGMMQALFKTDFDRLSPENLLDLRQAIDRAKGLIAFGEGETGHYEHDPLKAQLLWHFGFWRLRQLRERHGHGPRDILAPAAYPGVVVLVADLCSFSSYVRDTADAGIIRESLTSFYSKARYQIINNGGMLYQFVGDEVIGLFGIPDADSDSLTKALATARALASIGESVSHHWQRQLDRVQTSGGLHIGMAVGELQIVSLRPFSRTHIGAIGDCINVAARLMSVADSSEIVVSNGLYQRFDNDTQAEFVEVASVEARNVGRIKAWKLPSPAGRAV